MNGCAIDYHLQTFRSHTAPGGCINIWVIRSGQDIRNSDCHLVELIVNAFFSCSKLYGSFRVMSQASPYMLHDCKHRYVKGTPQGIVWQAIIVVSPAACWSQTTEDAIGATDSYVYACMCGRTNHLYTRSNWGTGGAQKNRTAWGIFSADISQWPQYEFLSTRLHKMWLHFIEIIWNYVVYNRNHLAPHLRPRDIFDASKAPSASKNKRDVKKWKPYFKDSRRISPWSTQVALRWRPENNTIQRIHKNHQPGS